MIRDQDLDPVTVTCRDEKVKEGSKKGTKETVCAPEDYESSFVWDAADNTIFRPISKFFQVDAYGESTNVNAFDEVPDSSWFVNRIGQNAMTPEEAARGYCPEGPELQSDPKEGAWFVDYGKDNGANPGFRVKVGETKYMFKTDDDVVERATAATAIASRIYYAAGYWAPCDAVVYFRRNALKLKPGLKVKANIGPSRKFDEAALTKTLSKTGRRGELFRATASRWLPGRALGPFTYEGKRDGDPSDVLPHEDRRDLRGAKIFAAWLNHFDSREQNSMSTWMPDNPDDPKSRGHVRHWIIDLGDCFGSEWIIDDFSKRHGHSYVMDFGYMAKDFGTLGVVPRPWEHARRTPGAEIFGYFSDRDFDPDAWYGEYPNPAFSRATELDAAWATRLIARFTPEHVAAAVKVGDFTDPAHTKYLYDTLIVRRQVILRRYFAKLSPVTDVKVESGSVCAIDLARRTKAYAESAFRYSSTITRGEEKEESAAPVVGADGRVCIPVGNRAFAPELAYDAKERYVVVKLRNGASKGPLVLHLYDLGSARGLRLVGIERPSS